MRSCSSLAGRRTICAAEWGERALFDPVKATRILKDGDKVTLGGVTLTARHTPGHTPGCTTFIMDVTDGGRTYNVVFPGSMTINPGTRLAGKESYPGIARDYARSLDFLESLKPDIVLMAHASAFDLAAKRDHLKKDPSSNPFGDVAGYRAMIAAKRADLQKQLKEQQEAARSDITGLASHALEWEGFVDSVRRHRHGIPGRRQHTDFN